MSGADLWEDGYPHGTPAGYDRGCQGGACPAGVAYGLSCKIAKAKSSGDFQYQKLARSGASIPEIADALGLVGTEPTAPQAKKAPMNTTPPKPTAPSPATAKGGRPLVNAPKQAADNPATTTPGAAPDECSREQRLGYRRARGPAAAGSATPREIRAWAIVKGYEVSAKGKLPQHIVDHYWEATGRLDAPGPLDTNTPETDTPAPETDTTPTTQATVTESLDAERARALAIRLEQELAHVTEQLEETAARLLAAADTRERMAEQARYQRAELDELSERLSRRAAERDAAEQRAHTAETACAFALQKWGLERAANESAHALILGQAHTINRLTDELAHRPRTIDDLRYTYAVVE